MTAFSRLIGCAALIFFGGVILVSAGAGFLRGLGVEVENPLNPDDPQWESRRMLLWMGTSVLLAGALMARRVLAGRKSPPEQSHSQERLHQ